MNIFQEKIEKLGYIVQYLKDEIRIYNNKGQQIAYIEKDYRKEDLEYSKELEKVLKRIEKRKV